MSAILLSSDKLEDIRLLTELAERLGVRLFRVPPISSDALIAAVLRIPSWEGLSVHKENLAPPQDAEDEMADAWHEAVRPIRQSQSIEDMEREQNYKGFDRTAFDQIQIVAELNIQDPDGELLQLLRA
jgi:hypothetical protein